MNIYELSGLLIAISSGSMVALMFFISKERLHYFWAVFCFCVFLFGLGIYFVGGATTPEVASLWWKIAHIGAILIPVLFLHFVHEFLGTKKTKILIFLYAVSSLLLIADFTDGLFIGNMRFVFGQFYYDSPPGLFYPLFTVIFFAVTTYSHYLLWKGYKESEDKLIKEKIKFFFFATAVGFAGGAFNFLPVYGIDIYPYMNLTVFLYPLIISYAIFKHGLFNVKIITVQFLVFIQVFILFLRAVFTKDVGEEIINYGILVGMILMGYFLIRSVLKEVEQTEQAKKLLDQRSEFLTIASHQLKTPVTGIMGILSFLHEGSLDKATPEERKNFIDGAYEKAVKLSDVIRDILFASDFDTKDFTIPEKHLVRVDVDMFLTKLYADFKERAEKKGLVLSYENRVVGACIILSDPRYLLQAMVNIVDNSIKYTLKGSVALILESTDDEVTITIRDTGVGVPLADQDKIFGKFNRASNAVDMYTDGSGLGLYISKEIIEAHEDGKIVMNSKEGEGTEFMVILKRSA